MRNRAFRAVAITASFLLMVAVPAQASPVLIGDVVQVVSGSQRNGGQNASVQLRFLEHDDRASAGSGTTNSTSASGNGSGASGDASLSASASLQDTGGIIQTDEFTEDIGVEQCDCEDFTVPVAGFPKWPFIPLVGLVCLTGICTDEDCVPKAGEDANCKPVEICTNCNQVPEPASLILFTSGIAALGASIRRRRSLKEVKDQQTTISGS